MKNYASAKGMPRHFAPFKVERKKDREYVGRNKRIQMVNIGRDKYVYSPERVAFGNLVKEVIAYRPLYRMIIHNARP